MDIDRINERLDRLHSLRRDLIELIEEAKALDVELEMGAIMKEIGLCNGWAAVLNEADQEALRRAYERMAR